MEQRLSAKDWLDQGLRTLSKSGFSALKADPLAKQLGVSRGSFYWHFADVAAFHAALLKHWHQVAAEQIIADLEAVPDESAALPQLLQRAFRGRPPTEAAMRSWATHDARVRRAVQEIDARRMSYVEALLAKSGLPPVAAAARARLLYWAFVGFALSEKPLSPVQQEALTAEILRIASDPA